ncbi:interleukin-1 receptor-associated kinase 4 isoform X4 [Sparus aurata]|uniref:interleukin-1 receptor-associated kinase 4 isoform X4 n=1 Tax=Sparus aurata TaxID=8175 RepID=UPI0011C1AFBD|nr:interleukin-1 receptor-associated kinase 4 isoform X4 [Sparus aurata]
MNNSVTSATYIRNLSYSLLRKVSDFLDPQDRWRDVMVSIRKSNGDSRYSQHHVRRFEGLVVQGKSPTVELLRDWGTTNSTVGELVDILKSHRLLAAASVLLPVTLEETVSAEPQQASPTVQTYSAAPTTLLEETETQTPADSSEQTQILQESSELGHTGCPSFFYNELMRITGNFDDRPVSDGGSRLGEGGFGTVYKGLLNDKPVAVKKLTPQGSPPLSWRQRCLIAEGTARGLEYLHNNHHVHRDVKSANILLDERFVAKVSDFGLTRASSKGTSTTMMTERIVGTRAYMAPEALRGEITPKSDVFSFGVVLLEILSGLAPADENREPQLLMEVWYDIDDEDEDLTLEDFLDKKMGDWELSQVESVYSLACSCLHERKNRRPFIKQVVLELKGVVKSISLAQE